jgi:pimeloyl-[acyl-carrier protein] synthase
MTTEVDKKGGDLKLFGPEMLPNPYPVYHRLRSTHPVVWAPALEAWVVTSYEAVSAGLRNPQLSSARFERTRKRLAGKGIDDLFDERAVSLIHKDSPDHTRLRGLVNKAFTPRAVDAMEDRIQRMVDEFLDRIQGLGRMDAIQDLAYPLPVTVIAEMLGVPPEDRDRFKKWSDEISLFFSGDAAALPAGQLRHALEARAELVDYFRTVVGLRRQVGKDDLLTALVKAEEGGGRLTEDELYSTAVLLLIAGNETTTNLIGNGLLALLRHPDQQLRLRNDPALTASAIEEMLRYDSPVQLTTRIAKCDLEIQGTKVASGQAVFLILAAANRDPAQFTDPDRFDVARVENKHIAFGAGPHFCLGAPLARLEAQVAFRTMQRRFPDLRLGEGPVEYRNNFNLRGLKSLPVVF